MSNDDAADDGPLRSARGVIPQTGSCRSCGSSRIIPDVGLNLTTQKQVVTVYGNPQALLLKDAACGELRARICGACGFTEFRVTNHAELYEKYQGAIGRQQT